MIAILGASSFLGRNLKTFFEDRGVETLEFSSRPEDLEDFFSEAQLRNFNLDAVFICGASQNQSDDRNSLYELIQSNVTTPGVLAEFLLRTSPNTKLIHFGSAWQADEAGHENPFNLYAASKTASEGILRHYAKKGLRIASLRLFDTYGPADSRPKLLNLILKTIKTRVPIDTTAGKQPLELVHISDVCSAVQATLAELDKITHKQLNIYDVGPEEEHTVEQVIKLACNLAQVNHEVLFKFGSRPYRENERMTFCIKNPVPGWKPGISLREGIQELLKTL